ncbi:hypothetical protein [Sorangium sp. So ce233]|uniref:hypothetical protein n=1 Tax=Sorangium sp. So ce233 TaxID=3133290 RepID=UPI003F5F3EB9
MAERCAELTAAAAVTAFEAARLGDSIGHSSAWSGLLTGAVAGVALAATVVAVVGTGGVAAVPGRRRGGRVRPVR